MTAIEFAYTLLFWLLTVALIVKSLSSEKNYLLLWHASLQFSKKNTFDHSSFLCFWAGLGTFSCLGDNHISFLKMILMEAMLTFMSLAIWLADLFGFLLTLSRIASIIFFDRARRGIPLLGRFSDVPNSLNLFTTWYTVDLATFKSLIISEFVLPEQWR